MELARRFRIAGKGRGLMRSCAMFGYMTCGIRRLLDWKDRLPLSDVGLILGHSDPRTTQRYVNRTTEVIRFAGAVLHEAQEHNQQEVEAEIQKEMNAVN